MASLESKNTELKTEKNCIGNYGIKKNNTET